MTIMLSDDKKIITKDNLDAVLAEIMAETTTYISIGGIDLRACNGVVYQDGELQFKQHIENNYKNVTDEARNQLLKKAMIRTAIVDYKPPEDKIAFLNGILNLRTGEFKESCSKEEILLMQTPYKYNKNSNNDIIAKAIEKCFTDPEQREIFLYFAAYCFMPWTCGLKKALFVLGDTDNRKSETCRMIEYALGENNTCAISLDLLARTPQHRYALVDKYANIVHEMPHRKVEMEFFKQLTAGDPVTIKRLYYNATSMALKIKQIYNGNSIYQMDYDRATINRMLVCIADNPIDPEERISDFAKYLYNTNVDAYSGFVNYLLGKYIPELLNAREFPIQQDPDFIIKTQQEYTDNLHKCLQVGILADPEGIAYNDDLEKYVILYYQKNKIPSPPSMKSILGATRGMFRGINDKYAYLGRRGFKGIKLKEALPETPNKQGKLV